MEVTQQDGGLRAGDDEDDEDEEQEAKHIVHLVGVPHESRCRTAVTKVLDEMFVLQSFRLTLSVCDGKIEKCHLSFSYFAYFQGHEKAQRFWGLDVRVDADNIGNIHWNGSIHNWALTRAQCYTTKCKY